MAVPCEWRSRRVVKIYPTLSYCLVSLSRLNRWQHLHNQLDLLGLLYRESHHLSLALDMEGILLPLLLLLDQQLTQPYLLVQYQSFLYCKKKGYAGTGATTGAFPPPLLGVSWISY